MDSIKIEVIGNIARVVEKPEVITSGTVGLPAEITFDSVWDGLDKTVVFKACNIKRSVVYTGEPITVPWEVLVNPGVWLTVGVTGSNNDGTIVIPTVYANVRVIKPGADTSGDPGADPTLPVWQWIDDEIRAVRKDVDELKEDNSSGIYIGADAPPDDTVDVWIDTDEEPEEPTSGKDGVGIVNITIKEV